MSDDEPGERPDDANPVDEWIADDQRDAERESADEDDHAGEDDHADEDPFERIGEGSGPRHGDPFDAFEAVDESSDSAANNATDDATGDETGGATDATTSDTDDAPGGLPAGADETAEDPFTEFDAPATDPFGEGETVFDRSDVGAADADGVWEQMESDADAEAVPGKRYVDVNKHSYCETCEYFSEPPEVSCSHEGTEILEFLDAETVRVVDCPLVAERTALEDVE